MASDITEEFQVDITNNATATLAVANSGITYDIAFNGKGFFDASSEQNPYRRQTAQYRKDQNDNSSEPGEQTLTGWWLRSQSSFHYGAGSNFYEPSQDQSLRFKFNDSEGVDVWTAGQVSLLKDTVARHIVTGTTPTHLRPIKYGSTNSALMVDDYDVDKLLDVTLTATVTNKSLTSNVATLTTSAAHGFSVGMNAYVTGVDATFNGLHTITAVTSTTFSYAKIATNVTSTAVTPNGSAVCDAYNFVDYTSGGADKVFSITDDGTNAFWLHNSGGKWTITKKPLTGTAASTADETLIYQASGLMTDGVIEFVKGRLIAAVDSVVYEVTEGGSPAADDIFTAKGTGNVFTAITESSSDIYLSMYNGINSDIIRITLSDSGSITSLVGAVTVASMPRGEIIHSIKYYLGYMLIGTSRGVRVAQVDGNGNVIYGPLLFETTQPVYQFATSDRYAWCTAKINGDAGLVRVDLGQPLDNLLFPYANDIQAIDINAECTGVGFLGETNRLVFSAASHNVYIESATVLRSSGYLTTGKIRFNTLEDKFFKYIKERADYSNGGSIGISSTDSDIVTQNASTGNQDVGIPETGSSDLKQFIFTLNRSASDSSKGPILYGYQLKALPASKKQRLMQYNVYCFDKEKDRYGNFNGYSGRAYTRLLEFENMEAASDIVTVQDYRTGETFQALIEECNFTGVTAPTKNFNGFGGVLTVTVRKI